MNFLIFSDFSELIASFKIKKLFYISRADMTKHHHVATHVHAT